MGLVRQYLMFRDNRLEAWACYRCYSVTGDFALTMNDLVKSVL
jgi:TPP-dependent 2-oxoacid decarboxylase